MKRRIRDMMQSPDAAVLTDGGDGELLRLTLSGKVSDAL